MRWPSLLLAALLALVPAPALAEGVQPDLIPVVAPETVLAANHQPLVARSLCTADPSKERRWEVLNLTREAVTFTWQVAETGQSGTLTLSGGAKTVVKAKAKAGKLTLRLLVNAEVVAATPNWGTRCAAQRPGQGLTWRRGPSQKAPTRPARPRPNQGLTWRKAPSPKAPTRPAKPAPGRSLTWQAPAPQGIVKVTPLCFRQPGERRWQVQNLTASPLTLTMELEGKPHGQLVLAPNGQTEIALEAGAPPNRLRLYQNGKLVAESAAVATACTPQ